MIQNKIIYLKHGWGELKNVKRYTYNESNKLFLANMNNIQAYNNNTIQ